MRRFLFFLHDSTLVFGTLLFSEVIPNMKGCSYAILTNIGRVLPTHGHGSYYQLKIVGEHQCHWNKNNLDDKWWLRKAKIFFSQAIASKIIVSLCFRIKQSGYHIGTFFWNALLLYNFLQLPCMLMIINLEQIALMCPLYRADSRWWINWAWKWSSILWASRQINAGGPQGWQAHQWSLKALERDSRRYFFLNSGFDSVHANCNS